MYFAFASIRAEDIGRNQADFTTTKLQRLNLRIIGERIRQVIKLGGENYSHKPKLDTFTIGRGNQ